MPTYFLSSLESDVFSSVRTCEFKGKLTFSTGKEFARVIVDPPVPMGAFGLTVALDELVLSARHEGHDLFPIKEFPCFVFVARLLTNAETNIEAKDVQILAWGEVYRTSEDAATHHFD